MYLLICCLSGPKPAMRCPAVPITSDTECLTTMQCDVNKPCDRGYHCCKTTCGGGTECKPGKVSSPSIAE